MSPKSILSFPSSIVPPFENCHRIIKDLLYSSLLWRPRCSQRTLKSIHRCQQPLHELAQNSFVNWLQNRVEVIWHQAEKQKSSPNAVPSRLPLKKAMHKRASSTIKTTILAMKKPLFRPVGSDSKIVETWKPARARFPI